MGHRGTSSFSEAQRPVVQMTPFWCILIFPFPLGSPVMHQRLVWEPFSSTSTVAAVSTQLPMLQRSLQAPSMDTFRYRKRHCMAIIFALNKFHQFLYGRTFILVTDHKPLIALFGPMKATPALAANRWLGGLSV